MPGCRDRFTLTIVLSDDRKVDRFPDLLLTIDGRKVRCVNIRQSDPEDIYGKACAENVAVELATAQVHKCEDRKAARCIPVDRYETNISIFGTPKSVSATIRYPSKLIETRVFTPHYTSSYPNGRDCDPPCTTARATWVLRKS